MSKDHLERRIYRKSPGRQYGYDYDPLHSQSGQSQSGGSHHGESASRSSTLLAQRPDPRRTRQLMRQSIIASKRVNDEDTESVDVLAEPRYSQRLPSRTERAEMFEERVPSTPGKRYLTHEEDYMPGRRSSSYSSRAARFEHPDLPATSELLLPEEEDAEYSEDDPYAANDWRHLNVDPLEIDPEFGIAEPRGRRQRYAETYPDDFVEEPLARGEQARRDRQPKPTRQLEPTRDYPDEDDGFEYEYEYEEDRPSVQRRSNKKRLTRRGLLLGAGVAAVAGIGVAATELAPKVPSAMNDVGTNMERQVQDAFNRGVTQGAEQARRELVMALDSLEGFSLEGAITAARLTRVAYDVFVSPLVRLGSALTGDFLSGMLKAFKTAREWLAGVYQDNATLVAIQKVLEAWVSQVSNMPKQLDAITQTDLDGAQAYLRALQRKIEDEKNKLSKPQGQLATPTVSPPAKPVPKK